MLKVVPTITFVYVRISTNFAEDKIQVYQNKKLQVQVRVLKKFKSNWNCFNSGNKFNHFYVHWFNRFILSKQDSLAGHFWWKAVLVVSLVW